MKLNPEKKPFLAIDRLTMTYSWYNIRSSYKNNTIKYSNDRGANWNTVTFKDGMYSYTDINDYLHQYMLQKNHHATDQSGNKTFHININFVLSTYRVLITLSDANFHVDLRGTDFASLIGFDKKIVTSTEYGTKLPNITNSIDVLNINTTAITDSIVNGVNTNTIAMIPTDTPRYFERYEDVVFELENQLNIREVNTQHQNRDGLKFVADNSGETTPFDWYNARLSVDFKVNKLADATAIAVDDNIGTVNGSNSLIKKIQVRAEGREVYDCDYANHCVNIKNLLEYSPSYAKSVGTNEYYFPDTSRSPDGNKFTLVDVAFRAGGNGDVVRQDNANYNKGFAARKVLLGESTKVNCEIPLNRYSFFEELQDRLLPNVRIEIQIEMDNDKNLIWRTGAADAAGSTYRLIITRLQLFVPRMTFNAEGQKLYLENYLKPHKWTYLTETTYNQNMGTQRTGTFRLTNGIPKPRHVFIFFYQ